jgi:hypothetical protein
MLHSLIAPLYETKVNLATKAYNEKLGFNSEYHHGFVCIDTAGLSTKVVIDL